MHELGWLTGNIVATQRRHAARIDTLYRGDLDEPFVAVRGTFFGASHGLWGSNEPDMLEQPEAWLQALLADMEAKVALLADETTFRPAAIEVDPLGTHFIDALFGAATGYAEGQVWAEKLNLPLEQLAVPDLSGSAILRQTAHLLRLAVEASDGKLWIGMPVLSCPINIAINLFGAEFLMALAAEPNTARHVLEVITEVIVTATTELCGIVPPEIRRVSVAADRFMPAGHGLIDGCATQMVSPQDYADALAPFDAATLACYPEGGMLHLCGASAQHAPAFAANLHIRTIQLNDRALVDLPLYLEQARADQIFYLSPCPDLPVAQCIELMQGRPFVLQTDCPA